MLRITFYNPEYTTAEIQEHNPFNQFIMTKDGFIIPRDT